MEIRKTIEEMESRMPWIHWKVLEPAQVQPMLANLGYDGWYDRCKYDVIAFHEEGEEKALLIWNLAVGPDRENPAKSWN
ncbi:MAG: hypothetical protein KJ970_16945 [Candidatus Eisenbacteria bacterium]|uniref:Uncharacterized protein n=1 Tax=Eiseniibacteriota bacterium TaxID=2212470 RepID=A0A948W7H4_UNCEI|nr:hypothetical protein [Candidatus Eisenbacteria bacterium]MBU1950182.1 hypothetical protein [Candidatus Eisenbacteria bacterium]MBU2692604.1 hypothetical protein [Candidatus Eisenbacteria bacterium]